MKYDNTLSAPHGFSLRDATAPVFGALGTAAGKVGTLLARGVTQMQISRMQSVLNSMSDAQLQQSMSRPARCIVRCRTPLLLPGLI